MSFDFVWILKICSPNYTNQSEIILFLVKPAKKLTFISVNEFEVLPTGK